MSTAVVYHNGKTRKSTKMDPADAQEQNGHAFFMSSTCSFAYLEIIYNEDI